jgi:hypothetical protein
LTVVAFLDRGLVAEQRRADVVLFEVERDAEDAVRELDQLAGRHRHRPVRTVPTFDFLVRLSKLSISCLRTEVTSEGLRSMAVGP